MTRNRTLPAGPPRGLCRLPSTRRWTAPDGGLPTSPPPPRPVLQRFGQVRRGDRFSSRQIGNRPPQLEHTMEGSRRQLELVHRLPHQRAAGLIQRAVGAHLGRPHVAVGLQLRPLEAIPLGAARCLATSRQLHVLGGFGLLRGVRNRSWRSSRLASPAPRLGRETASRDSTGRCTAQACRRVLRAASWCSARRWVLFEHAADHSKCFLRHRLQFAGPAGGCPGQPST